LIVRENQMMKINRKSTLIYIPQTTDVYTRGQKTHKTIRITS
jgi:hypothetical protein